MAGSEPMSSGRGLIATLGLAMVSLCVGWTGCSSRQPAPDPRPVVQVPEVEAPDAGPVDAAIPDAEPPLVVPEGAAKTPLGSGRLGEWQTSLADRLSAAGASTWAYAVVLGDRVVLADVGASTIPGAVPEGATTGPELRTRAIPAGEVTRALTGLMIAALIQEGHLIWTSPLSQLRPDWPAARGGRPVAPPPEAPPAPPEPPPAPPEQGAAPPEQAAAQAGPSDRDPGAPAWGGAEARPPAASGEAASESPAWVAPSAPKASSAPPAATAPGEAPAWSAPGEEGATHNVPQPPPASAPSPAPAKNAPQAPPAPSPVEQRVSRYAAGAEASIADLVCSCFGVIAPPGPVPRRHEELLARVRERLAAGDPLEAVPTRYLAAAGGYLGAQAGPSVAIDPGAAYAQQLDRRVLRPLGMDDTRVEAPGAPGRVPIFAPADGVWSTVDDLARAAVAYTAGGLSPTGGRVVEGPEIDALLDAFDGQAGPATRGGWRVDARGAADVRWLGRAMAKGVTRVVLAPEAGLALVIRVDGGHRPPPPARPGETPDWPISIAVDRAFDDLLGLRYGIPLGLAGR